MNNVTVNTNINNQVFNFGDYQVRTVIKEGEPWFVAKDVADILDYSEASAMTRHLDDDDKESVKLTVRGQEQEFILVNESGLYSAILKSRKPEAKAFKKWVTSEVLPSIRKQGKYEVKPAVPQSYSQALLEAGRLAAIVEQQELLVKQQELQLTLAAPKVEYVDKFVEHGNNRTVTDVAKELGVSGIALGRWLRNNNYAWKNKTPMRWKQSFIDAGYGVQKMFSNEQVNKGTALITPEGDIFIKENFAAV